MTAIGSSRNISPNAGRGWSETCFCWVPARMRENSSTLDRNPKVERILFMKPPHVVDFIHVSRPTLFWEINYKFAGIFDIANESNPDELELLYIDCVTSQSRAYLGRVTVKDRS